jgi:hypothetical protein
MAFSNDNGIAFSMTEEIEKINSKNPQTGGYAIPTEMVIQKYLQERINPSIPTTSILAALDQRKWEQKQQANAQAPQQTVLEETITEVQTANAPQGIQQGQPRPQPQQQMAGLQRPPMPGGVTPQQRMGTGIPMMAAAGGYVPNFADGGIIGYKERGYVSPNKGGYNTNDFYSQAQEYNNKYYGQAGEYEQPTGRYSKAREWWNKLTSGDSLEDRKEKDIAKTFQLITDEELKLSSSPFEQLSDTERDAIEERRAELNAIKSDLLNLKSPTDAPSPTDIVPGGVVNSVIEDKQKEVAADGGGSAEVGNDFTGLGYEEQKPSADLQAFIDSQKTLPGKEVIDTEEDILASIYGPNSRPEMISEEDFKSQLSGTGTAFAGQKTKTEGFRDALNKRADEAGMSTGEVLLSLGLGLMADPGKRGEEFSSLGKAGITTMSEFGKRKDKAEGLRDKAMALDLKLGDAEIALEQAAVKYGVESKQFKAKEKQFDALYEQKERLSKIEETGKDRRVETTGKYAVQAAEATADKEYNKEFRNAVSEMQQLYLKDEFTMGDLRQVLKEGFDPKNPKLKSNIAGAQAYLRNMKGVYEAYGKSYKGDSDLVELEKRLLRPSITYQTVEQGGKKYKVGSDGSSELIN